MNRLCTPLPLLFLALPMSCFPGHDDSSVKVLNGVEVASDEYPEVQKLDRSYSDKICTGSFVSHNTFLTANHCVDLHDHTAQELSVNGVHPIAAYDHPFLSMGRKYDLAVLIFPSHTSDSFTSILNRNPVAGDSLTIVGFGINQSEADRGVKRKGTNTLDSVMDGVLTFTGDARPQVGSDGTSISTGEDVSARGGDSGGPLFIQGMLAGTTSGGGGNKSHYVDLNSDQSRFVLQKAVDLGAEIPGYLPFMPSKETVSDASSSDREKVSGVWLLDADCSESNTRLELNIDLKTGLKTDTELQFELEGCQGKVTREILGTKPIIKLYAYHKADGAETLVLAEKSGESYVETELAILPDGRLKFLERKHIYSRVK